MSKFAWVTLTTNDTYALGSLVLANSLRRVGTQYELAVLVTPGVSDSMRERLRELFHVVQEVNVLDSQDAANLALLARPELGITFTKLHAWRLLQFEKCVFLDSDTLILKNSDELFERAELSAAPDVSWPDCFNSGVFVYQPSLETFNKLVEFAVQNGSFDGGDQGLLNSYFSDWATGDIKKHLPFIYNVAAFASYTYLPAFKQFRDKIKILHFAGKLKPWLINFDTPSKTASIPSDYAHAAEFIQLWWSIFCDNVHEKLTGEMNLHTNFTCHNLTTQLPQLFHSVSSGYMHCIQNNFDDTKHSFHDPWEEYYNKIAAENQEEAAHKTELIITETEENEISNTKQEEDEKFNELTNNFDKTAEGGDETCSFVVNRPFESDETRNEIIVNASDGKVSPACTIQENTKLNENVIGSQLNENLMHLQQKTNSKDNLNIDSEYLQSESRNFIIYEAGLAGALSQLRLGVERTPEQEVYEQLMRRQCWESGQIDYRGKDSFDNVWKKITQTLDTKPEGSPQQKDSDQPGSST